MPKKMKPKSNRQTRKTKQPSTPRVRPLEALLRRGQHESYQDATELIADEGPLVHPEGSTILQGHWKNEEEWVEEKFRITRETLDAARQSIGLSSREDVDAILAHLEVGEAPNRAAAPPRTPVQAGSSREKGTEESGDPWYERQTGMMRDLRSRVVAVGVLQSMPSLDDSDRVRAESMALQAERILEIIRNTPRRPVREIPGKIPWRECITEMTAMTKRMAGAAPPSEEAAREYAEAVTGWMESIQWHLSEHTIQMPGGPQFRISVGRGINGKITCTPAEDGPPIPCPWPECLGPDPRKCRHTGRSWRECGLPDETDTQSRTKYLIAKHDDLFPYPPEWEEELKRLEALAWSPT